MLGHGVLSQLELLRFLLLRKMIHTHQDVCGGQQEEDAPDSIHELSEMAKIKLVLADSADPDGVAFVRWRASFYVAGKDNEALHNLLYLLDAFFVWANQDRDPKVTARSVACW